jgi:hypothetical protein
MNPLDKNLYPWNFDYLKNFLYVVDYIFTSSVILKNFNKTDVRFDTNLLINEDWELWLKLKTKLNYSFYGTKKITTIYNEFPNIGKLSIFTENNINIPAFLETDSYKFNWEEDSFTIKKNPGQRI